MECWNIGKTITPCLVPVYLAYLLQARAQLTGKTPFGVFLSLNL